MSGVGPTCYVTYQTVVPGEQGLVFRSDVYDRDSEFAALSGATRARR